jgi:integrase
VGQEDQGRTYYFGAWADPDAALKKYLGQRDDLHAGRAARETAEGLTVKELCNHFLNAKRRAVDGGELSPRTWDSYRRACDAIVGAFGKSRRVDDLAPKDFAKLRNRLAQGYAVTRLALMIQCVRGVFKYAADNRLIDRPPCYGAEFKRPSKKVMRLDRARHGPRLFTAAEIWRLLDDSLPAMKAIILLGINCGFGNADCGNLPLSALDLERGIIDFPRPKTGIPRRCVLWPETVQAIRDFLAKRPRPKAANQDGLVFLTRHGLPWARETDDGPIAKRMRNSLRRLGINGRHRLGFYTLRHTFRTVADEAKDQPAADYIMGHEVPHMSTVYRETISDARLKAVAQHVHDWLFPPRKDEPKPKGEGAAESSPSAL